MSASTIGQDAARLLAEAIAAGRLSAKPDPAALARIANIVTAGHANAKGWTPRRSQKEVRHHRTQVRR